MAERKVSRAITKAPAPVSIKERLPGCGKKREFSRKINDWGVGDLEKVLGRAVDGEKVLSTRCSEHLNLFSKRKKRQEDSQKGLKVDWSEKEEKIELGEEVPRVKKKGKKSCRLIEIPGL